MFWRQALRDRAVPAARVRNRTSRASRPRLEAVEPRLMLDAAATPLDPTRIVGDGPDGFFVFAPPTRPVVAVPRPAAVTPAATVEPPPAPVARAAVPPHVVAVARQGVHRQRPTFTVTFDQPMNFRSVLGVGAYLLETAGADGNFRDSRNVPIPIATMIYVPTDQFLMIVPARRISLHEPVKLTIDGDLAGLTNASGVLLDGNGDGRPGGTFTTIIDGFDTEPLPRLPVPRPPLRPFLRRA